MSDDYAALTAASLEVTPARELLSLAGDLFRLLLAVPGEFTDADMNRGRVLRLTLAEVTDRAARIFPDAYYFQALPCGQAPHAEEKRLAACACSCGEVFATPGELDVHFWSVFVPVNGVGLDGKRHRLGW
jgi:hypothetical protein